MKNVLEIVGEPYNLRNRSRLGRCRAKLVHYATEIVRFIAPKLWDTIPIETNNSETLETFKNCIKVWKPVNCKYRLCKN